MTKLDELPDEMFLTELEQPGRQTLSFSRSPTVLLNFAANRFTRNASRHYQSAFGIGAMDWRMLVSLTRNPGSRVSHASTTIGIDKGAVSRSLTRLEKAGLVEAQCNSPDERRKEWFLTDRGQELHDTVLVAALERQKHLLRGFSRQDVSELNRLLSKLLENLDGSEAEN